MTMPPLPGLGTTNWMDWAAGVHEAAEAVTQGRLTDASLGADFVARGDLVVSVKDYGAVGDGGTDDHTGIAAAVAAVAARGGGVVYFPPGIYAIGQKLSVSANIYLVGEHAYASVIKLIGTAIATFVEFGTAGAISTYTGVRRLQVDTNAKADTGVLIHGPQEGAGIDQAFVLGALERSAHFDGAGVVGGSNMSEVARSWLWTTGDAGMYGLYVTGGIVHVRSSTFVGVDRTGAAPAGSAGIAVVDGFILDQGNNAEEWESGRRLTRSTAQILTPESSGTSYGVTTSSDSTNTALMVDNAGWSNATADINDVGQSVTIQYGNSYRSAGPLSNARHFQRGWHILDRADIYKNDAERTVLGYGSPASGDVTHYKTSVLTPTGWIVGSMVDGVDGTNGANSSSWSNAHHRIGNYHLWVDSSGRLRIKNGAPTSDTDGTVVGTQT